MAKVVYGPYEFCDMDVHETMRRLGCTQLVALQTLVEEDDRLYRAQLEEEAHERAMEDACRVRDMNREMARRWKAMGL